MEIRLANQSDIPGLIRLLRQVGQVHHRGRPDLFRSDALKYSPSQVLSILERDNDPIFIAAEEGNVLGYGFCQIRTYRQDSVIADHSTCYIDDLCIHEDCRGQHIGTELYKAVCRYAKEQDCYSVTLNVWTCNPGAMAFYEKLGLKPQKVGMEHLL